MTWDGPNVRRGACALENVLDQVWLEWLIVGKELHAHLCTERVGSQGLEKVIVGTVVVYDGGLRYTHDNGDAALRHGTYVEAISSAMELAGNELGMYEDMEEEDPSWSGNVS